MTSLALWPCTLFQQLHWLSIKHHIDFKTANITFRTLHFSQPAYLCSSLHVCHSTRSLPLVPSDSPTPISFLLRLSAHHLALTASASQPLKSGTLSLYLSVPVPVLIPFVVTSRPTTASRPSNPFNPSPLAPQIRLCRPLRAFINYIYLLTYVIRENDVIGEAQKFIFVMFLNLWVYISIDWQ